MRSYGHDSGAATASITTGADAIPASAGPVIKAARPAMSRSKRSMDILLSAALLVFLSPLLLLVTLAVMLDSPGPVLFRQKRSGLGGQPFEIFKFRTMYVHQDGAEIKQATRDDPRVTRVGAILRRSSIDELPQLLNVLIGDMSLVGPRPHALAHDARFSAIAPRYYERFQVRPGITGLAQVNGSRGEVRNNEQAIQRTALDREYIATWSFSGDIAILVRTALVIFIDENAY